MNPLRALILPVLFLLLTGCMSYHSEKYTRFRATNERDDLVAEWVARGRIVPLERGGYRITAVERITAPPFPTVTHYPDGWRTSVQGAHIWHWRCPKPRWLAELEGDVPPGATLR